MQYADSVHKVLLRKINRAEQELMQLKLDYCRFIFDLTHRSQVDLSGRRYQIVSVDVGSMARQDDGSFGKPEVTGVPVDNPKAEPVQLGKDWTEPVSATRSSSAN